MKVDSRVVSRLDELITTGNKLAREVDREWPLRAEVVTAVQQWAVSTLSILKRVFGETGEHYQRFAEQYENIRSYNVLATPLGVLLSAKDDYANAYLFDTKQLITAEVFDDFLEQANHLFQNGYFGPAAVLAGAVLEDGLRRMCVKLSISLQPKATIDPMNGALAKQGAYDTLVQKRITMLADLRNKAAHGKWDDFSQQDVENMISDVRRFLTTHFSSEYTT